MKISIKVTVEKRQWRRIGFASLIGGLAMLVYAAYDAAARGVTYSLVSLVLLVSALLFISMSAEI